MKKIITINNPLLKPLYQHAQASEQYNIEVLSEIKTIEAINNSKCDIALVSPLVFAIINKDHKFKIVKSNLLAIEDFSGEFTINIAPNKKKLATLYPETLNEFIIVCTKLVLSERFGIDVSIATKPQEADIILSTEKEKYPDYIKLDLTEDWFDTFEVPLVAGFWIANYELYNKDIVDEINSLSKNLDRTENIISEQIGENDYDKIGYKH